MALRCTTTNHHAYCPTPWASGSGSVAFWFYKPALATATIGGLIETADAGYAGTPRITWGTVSDASGTCGYVANSGSSNNAQTTSSWTAATWQHYVVRWNATGTTINTIGSAFNGTPDTMVGSARDMAAGGNVIERLYLGRPDGTSNVYIAYFAYYGYELSDAQITELQTKYPDAISGTDPIIYCPFLADDDNDGTGGATYDFTLSGATIDSTNDGTLPTLSSAAASNPHRYSALLGIG